MTKYIDRYYLNGEMYGIKFAGGGGGRQPGANTILYCPLKDNIDDATGNHTMSLVTTGYGTVAKDSTGYYLFNGGCIQSESYTGPTQGTMSVWFKRTGQGGFFFCMSFKNDSPYHYFSFNGAGYGGNSGAYCISNAGGGHETTIPESTLNTWEHWLMTYDSTDGGKMYVNGTLISTLAANGNLQQYNSPTSLGAPSSSNFYSQYQVGYISEAIIEDRSRTAQEVADYFNQTKSLYGIA